MDDAPATLGEHDLQNGPAEVKGGVQIGGQHLIPLGIFEFCQPSAAFPGAHEVEQDIYTVKRFTDVFHSLSSLGGHAGIGQMPDRPFGRQA